MRSSALRALAGLLLLVTTACASTAAPGNTPGTAELLYVANQNDATVSVIDMRTNRVIRTVDLQRLGFGANAKPHHIAVEPDGSYWYVSLIGENRIVKLNARDQVVAQAQFETPGMMSLHPTEDLLYVGRSMTAVNAPPRIGVLRRSNMSIEEIDVLFPRPHAIGLNPHTGIVYTASLGVNQIAAVDAAEEEVRVIDVPGPAHALMQWAISPDGRTAVISGELSHTLMVFDISQPMNPRLTHTLNVERQPFDPMFTPDGRWVYFGNKAANTITVVDMAGTPRVAAVIENDGIAQPHGVAVSADGSRVYISNNNLSAAHDMSGDHAGHAMPATAAGRGRIVVVDVATQRVTDVIEVGNNASGIATRTPRP